MWNRTIGGDRRQRRWRGSAAYLSIHRRVDQVGRHCDLLFIAWQLAQPHQHATRKDLNPTGFKPLSFWHSAALQYANPRALMLAAATAGSFIVSNATVASIAVIVIVFSIAAIGSLVTWAWVRAALRTGLAPARECEPSTSRWACSSPPPHCGWRCCEGHAITSPAILDRAGYRQLVGSFSEDADQDDPRTSRRSRRQVRSRCECAKPGL